MISSVILPSELNVVFLLIVLSPANVSVIVFSPNTVVRVCPALFVSVMLPSALKTVEQASNP